VRPIVGADQVGRALADGLPRLGAAASVEPVPINGYPGLIIRLNGEIDDVVAMRMDDGLISGLYVVRNPQKLSRLDRETAMSR
jgi:RNA polymerase sigma-70 factor, ECF subfamily